MSYPDSKLAGISGFAKAQGVTGGWAGSVVYVETLDQLQKALEDTTPRVVVLNRNIRADSLTKVYLGANKTLVGSYENRTLNNIHFRSTEASGNIIFQNLVLQHSREINQNDDIQLYLSHGNKYWIDHVTWEGHEWADSDHSTDKLLYIGAKADWATVSNCLFKNHRYGLIFGWPADDQTGYDGFPHLTVCHCHFENVYTRAPGLARYGYFHFYNNYINNFALGFTIATGAKIVSEANYFGAGSEKNGMLDDKGTGTFTDSGSYPALPNKTSPPSKWTPSSNYAYVAKTAQEAKQFTTEYAGAQSARLVFGG